MCSVALLGVLMLIPLLLAGCAAVGSGTRITEVFRAAPWKPGERLEYSLRNAAGDEVGRGVLTTEQHGDRLLLTQTYASALASGGPTTSDTIALTVDGATLAPVQGTRDTFGRDADRTAGMRTWWTYGVAGDHRRMATLVEGLPALSELDVREHAYDVESSLWLWRGIVFSDGNDQTYASANPFAGSQQAVTLRVLHREQVSVPAGTYDAWRILVRSGQGVHTAWVSTRPPHPVVRWDRGDVILELTSSK